MRKRHAFFSTLVEPYSTLNDFAKDKEEWLAIVGIELGLCEKYVSLYIQLGYDDYESYHVIPDGKGKLAVSHVIWWQDQYCSNDLLDIFTLESVEEEEIFTSI